jgi:hypothetical protein
VVHLDRVYLPSLQPRVAVRRLDLQLPDGVVELMRNNRYVVRFGEPWG